MPIPQRSTRQLRWPQVASLAAAGLISFAAAAFWNRATGDEAEDLVMPAVRPGAPLSTESKKNEQPDSSPLPPSSGDGSLQMTSNPARLNSQVTRNPFGDLNLLASVELAARKNDVNTIKTVTAAPRPNKPKVQAPPPPSPVVEAPPPAPPPPMAPTLPFTVVGGISGQRISDGRPIAFLRTGEEIVVVRPGDTIGKAYLVESVTTDKIELTYLPLMQRQILRMKP